MSAAATASRAVRLLRHPGRAWRLLTRRAFPIRALLQDPETYHAVSAWTYGRLPRVPVTSVVPTIADADVRLSRFLSRHTDGAPTVLELTILCGLVHQLRARRVLEIGTFDGGTTLNLAENVSDDGMVTTVDLPPDWRSGNAGHDPGNVPAASMVGQKFRAAPSAKRIRQVFGDSARLDWRELGGPFDLIFIDGSHEYEYVRQDTANALRVIRPGGLILWHDYGIIEGVSRAVDDAAVARCVLLGTSLAFAAPAPGPDR
jgi:predicted O-methyltransferase YrrM